MASKIVPQPLHTYMDDLSSQDQQMFTEIKELLRERSTPSLPLVPLFEAILNGTGTRQQYRRFGEREAKVARAIILETLFDYATETGNATMMWILVKYRDFDVRRPGCPNGPKYPVPDGVQVPNTLAYLALEAFSLVMSLP